jgi:hypothetical protein
MGLFTQIEGKFRDETFVMEAEEFANEEFPGKKVVILEHHSGIGPMEAKHLIDQKSISPDYKHSHIQYEDWMAFRDTLTEKCKENVVCIYPYDRAYPEWGEFEIKREDLEGIPIERLYWKNPDLRFREDLSTPFVDTGMLHNSYEAPAGNVNELKDWVHTADPEKINRGRVTYRMGYSRGRNWRKLGPPIIPQRATISQVREIYKASKESSRYRHAIIFTRK